MNWCYGSHSWPGNLYDCQPPWNGVTVPSSQVEALEDLPKFRQQRGDLATSVTGWIGHWSAKYPGKEGSFVTCDVDEVFCMPILDYISWDCCMGSTQHLSIRSLTLTQVLAFGTLPWRPNIAKGMLQVVPVPAIPLLNLFVWWTVRHLCTWKTLVQKHDAMWTLDPFYALFPPVFFDIVLGK